MALLALNQDNKEVFADENINKNDNFHCRHCYGKLSFVNAKLRIKHFRHKVQSNCDPEPETEEHMFHKKLVFKTLLDLNLGETFLEPSFDTIFRPDVYLKREQKRDIVFEIQATNNKIDLFEKKIKYYSHKGYIIVYLFVPGNFFYQPRNNVYSLKEIEKRILVFKSYSESVIGAYINQDKILLPDFENKYAKGGDGYCSTRFIILNNFSRCIPLRQYLNEINTFVSKERYLPVCNHEDFRYELVSQKIIRYKKMCNLCGKFIKWLPNDEAQKLGLLLKSG